MNFVKRQRYTLDLRSWCSFVMYCFYRLNCILREASISRLFAKIHQSYEKDLIFVTVVIYLTCCTDLSRILYKFALNEKLKLVFAHKIYCINSRSGKRDLCIKRD